MTPQSVVAAYRLPPVHHISLAKAHVRGHIRAHGIRIFNPRRASNNILQSCFESESGKSTEASPLVSMVSSGPADLKQSPLPFFRVDTKTLKPPARRMGHELPRRIPTALQQRAPTWWVRTHPRPSKHQMGWSFLHISFTTGHHSSTLQANSCWGISNLAVLAGGYSNSASMRHGLFRRPCGCVAKKPEFPDALAHFPNSAIL